MVRQQWARPEWHATIDSTNAALLADPTPGRVVVADHQSAGQGRRGRTWSAPPGAALAVSVALSAPKADLLGWVPLLAGIAVVRALRDSDHPVVARLKWPNDVLVPAHSGGRGGKVCGVLAVAQGSSVVVGAGLNINQDERQLPVDTATSWRLALGEEPLPSSIRHAWLTAYLDHLGCLLEDLAGEPDLIREAYTSICSTLGHEVTMELPDGAAARGVARSIDQRGALVIEQGGRRTAHHAGDVVHLRGAPPSG